VAVRPTPEMLAAAEDSAAQAVLAAEPGAVGVYDHVPVRGGAAVFTMDTASEVFMLHSGKVTISRMCCPEMCPTALTRSGDVDPAFNAAKHVHQHLTCRQLICLRSMLMLSTGGAAGGGPAGGVGADVDIAAGGGGRARGAGAGAGPRAARRGAAPALPAPGAHTHCSHEDHQ
jgi:hypothetical protein